MPGEELATGWDLGGAHLKAVQSDSEGGLQAALQVPCTLWRGLDHLARAIAEARQKLAPTQRHGITMTGELADLFLTRAEGVDRLTAAMRAAFPDADLRIYAGEAGFIAPSEATHRVRDVASANWHASARFVAARHAAGLFVDIGSTTTDIIPFADGLCRAVGCTDDERLISEELVYTGVTRTPVMALADAVPFAGQRQRFMAEYFATVADVHRLTGALPDDADQHDTADGRGKSPEDSARRLARMLGRDLESADMAAWRRLARHLSERQLQVIQSAADCVLSRGVIAEDAPVIGAGIGRFLARALAGRLGRPYIDFATLVSGTPEACEWAARCAPAAAVAALAAAG
jgi:(4-(4-[2-(gamma-L-glutamylamino)ethyl]phenoxymethyl)furan-2-yl)methanamine synthase